MEMEKVLCMNDCLKRNKKVNYTSSRFKKKQLELWFFSSVRLFNQSSFLKVFDLFWNVREMFAFRVSTNFSFRRSRDLKVVLCYL